jgi:hypothetical protein
MLSAETVYWSILSKIKSVKFPATQKHYTKELLQLQVSCALFRQLGLQSSHLLFKSGDVSLVRALLLQQLSPLRLQAVHSVVVRRHQVHIGCLPLTQFASSVLYNELG